LTLSAKRWLALRAISAIVEPRGDVTHIFGGRDSWHFLQCLGRRPILLTAVVSGSGVSPSMATHIARVAVETESGIDEWLRVGLSRDRIEVVRPGIDLDWFRPSTASLPARFTLLFASTPSDPAEIESRGIPLLAELARARSDIDILIPWRLWGDINRAQERVAALRPSSNLKIHFGNVQDMRAHYAGAHATIVCFEAGAGKSCPNFVLEGLACGRPCVSTVDGGLAAELLRAKAGVVVPRDVTALSEAVDQLRLDWAGFSDGARLLAESSFDVALSRARYDQLYNQLAGS
jgi:glycosyltransferase involved in cell wall biosynthesis